MGMLEVRSFKFAERMHTLTIFRPPAVAFALRRLFLALILVVPLGVGLGQDFEGKTITEVEIRYRGAKTVSEARLRNFMGTKAGGKYSNEQLDEDIRNLYESGLVDDVIWLAEPKGGQVKLIAEVTTRPALGGVGFVGNTAFSDKKLARESGLKGGGSLSDEQILQARRKIEDYYFGYGYPDVMVTHRMQGTDRAGVADLVFVIDEGGKSEVRKIRFEGNNSIDSKTLRKEMKTKPKGLFSFLSKSGRYEVEQLDEDVEAVLDYYRNKGYLRVSSPGVRREPVKDGRVDLVIPINEGAKYTVKGVAFGRMTVFTSDELYPALTLQAGKPYSAEKMRADITMIRDYYGSRGYADATVTPDIRNAGPNEVNVIYRITEGKRYRVGRVNISGNVKTQDRVIRREIPLKPGDYFNSVELETTDAVLTNLNYFNDVQVSGSPAGGGYRDINVLVDEKKTGQVSFGLGFSSVDSVVGYVTVEQSNFDITNPWSFTGGGQRFSASLRAGSERRDFSISLVEPWFMGRKLAFGGELYYKDAYYLSDVYDQTNVGGALFFRWPISDKAYLRAEYRMENVDISPDGLIPGGSYFDNAVNPGVMGDFLRSAVAVNYVYDSRDSNITPRRGEKIDVGVTLAGGLFGGDVETYTVRAAGTKHWNLWWDTILTINGELAVVDTMNNGDRVPVSDLLALGGARTLRGFEYRDVGPRDVPGVPYGQGVPGVVGPGSTGEVFGGQSLAFVSFEYTVPLVENVRAAAFFDAGMVNRDAWDFDTSMLHSDAGIGLRLNLPFGPLALDYAIPIESPDPIADKGGQFQFYLNYQF
jgi:outer membrane protein insertion porin family